MKKILYFIGLFAYAMAIIGGIGYTVYCKAYVIAIAVALMAYMAFPTAKDWFLKLTNNGKEKQE